MLARKQRSFAPLKNGIISFRDQKKMACRPNSKYCPCAGIKESDRKRIFTSENKTNHKLQFLPLIYAASNEMKRETD